MIKPLSGPARIAARDSVMNDLNEQGFIVVDRKEWEKLQSGRNSLHDEMRKEVEFYQITIRHLSAAITMLANAERP